jgi:hypothetical protein
MAKSSLCSHRLVKVHLHENTLILPIIKKDYSVFRINGGERPLLSQDGGGSPAWVHSDITINYKRLFSVQDQWRGVASAPTGWRRSNCMSTIWYFQYERLFCVQDQMEESGLCSHRQVEVYLHGYSVFRINSGDRPLLTQAGEGLLAWEHSDITNNYKRLFCVQDQWRRVASAPIGWRRSTCMSTLW